VTRQSKIEIADASISMQS